jgi:hypothetical protein
LDDTPPRVSFNALTGLFTYRGETLGRPRRNTADYFPHACHHGKTIYVLEQAYGNDGYAFWFKLLEALASAPGHYLDFGGMGEWDRIVARALVDDRKAVAIMDTLARLEAIDTELWDTVRVVWVENLTDALGAVYRKRQEAPPARPVHLLPDESNGRPKDMFDEFRAPETGVKGGFSRIEILEKGEKEEKVKREKCSVPSELTGLELYEVDDKLCSRFEKNMKAWKKAYPFLDVLQEIRKAHAWEMANPKRRKKDRARFIANWLSRADESRAKRGKANRPGTSIEEILKDESIPF